MRFTKSQLTKKHSGQVLPLTAVLLGFLGLSVFFLYNSNIIVNERIRTQNTADAAAYSTATMDSRYLNFMAYSNRAMIADHVITAQFIGLASHGKMLKQAGSNLEMALGWIPYYGYYIKIMAQALNYYSTGLDYAANVEVPVGNALTKIISMAQQGYSYALPFASTFLTQKVVEANDKDSKLSTVVALGHTYQLADFLKQYSPENASSNSDNEKRSDEFYDVTMSSRNVFAAKRSGDWQWFKFKIPFVVEFYPVKYGGTDMRSSSKGPKKAEKYKTLAAMDTISVQLRTFTCSKWGIPKWCSYYEVPIGYGSGTGGDSYNFANDKSKSLYGDGAWRNKLSATLQTYYGEKYENSNYDGLQPFYDIKKTGRVDSAPTVYVALTKSEESVRTAKNIGFATSSKVDISEKGSFRNGKQFVVAKANAYFQRPTDIESAALKPSKREFGNLYNPFWQPRLVTSVTTESQGLMGLVAGG